MATASSSRARPSVASAWHGDVMATTHSARRHLLRTVTLAALLVVCLAASALAQATVRVTSDRTTVWNPGFTTVATLVNAGTVLEVVGRDGTWYEVVLPGPSWQPRTTGFIAVSRVEVASGTPPVEGASAAGGAGAPAGDPRRRQRARQGQAAGARRPNAPGPVPALRVFGEAGYGQFTAKDTFNAVFGSPGGPWFGGGAVYTLRSGLFLQGGVEHFRATGKRVFVSSGTVYPLGIEDRIAITPLMAVAGVRTRGSRLAAYAGGGAGVYRLRETSDFADEADNVKENHPAYRAFAGVEWRLARSTAAAVEVQYTTVPDALTAGAAAAFGEKDLGGVVVKAKLLFGR